MSDKKHIVSIDSDFRNTGYYAACSCGWCGPIRKMLAIAGSDGREHEVICELVKADDD